MKKILSILTLFISINLRAQNYPITVSLSLPNNPNANTINWGEGTSMLMIKASAKVVGTKIDQTIEESKILLTIKKGSAKICGANTGNSAPDANFNSAMKVWVGKNAVALLGQNCVLLPGDYTICVQFFGSTTSGFKPLSDEISKPFSIKSDDQKALLISNFPNGNTGKTGIQSITRTWIADDTSSTRVVNKLNVEGENKTKQSTVTCDCNKDMYVIAQVNSTGYKIRCRETKMFDLGTTIHFIPQNICNLANCLTDWNMAVNDALTGAFVTSGTVTSNTSSIALTLNSVNGYKITWAGHCNGKKCECEFWIKKK